MGILRLWGATFGVFGAIFAAIMVYEARQSRRRDEAKQLRVALELRAQARRERMRAQVKARGDTPEIPISAVKITRCNSLADDEPS